jgi:hypothetical protein
MMQDTSSLQAQFDFCNTVRKSAASTAPQFGGGVGDAPRPAWQPPQRPVAGLAAPALHLTAAAQSARHAPARTLPRLVAVAAAVAVPPPRCRRVLTPRTPPPAPPPCRACP